MKALTQTARNSYFLAYTIALILAFAIRKEISDGFRAVVKFVRRK